MYPPWLPDTRRRRMAAAHMGMYQMQDMFEGMRMHQAVNHGRYQGYGAAVRDIGGRGESQPHMHCSRVMLMER